MQLSPRAVTWPENALLGVVDEVFPVDVKVVERAKALLLERRRLSARDALHVAVMEREGIERT